ncbi:Hypothetical predicted protein [Cloeon dipterum]|uniref:BTB domain-containing protein n=1 Tax=Cloeon dipterum TaxID=197152 RepID=A0A8S1DK33_9INSE|nr:Hypothetical predicted protein [Cloeon dipterum]
MVVQVACSGLHTLALTSKGKVFAFGSNHSGQLGLGTTSHLLLPRKVRRLLDRKVVTSVACQKLSSFVLLHSGKICAWGCNLNGRLGSLSTSLEERNPCKVRGLERVVISKIVCGDNFTLALSDDGKIFSWGENEVGQLGNGARKFLPNPTIISTEMGRIKDIAATLSASHPCAAITENNQVYLWGRVNGLIVETPVLALITSFDEVFTIFYPKSYQCFHFNESKITNNNETKRHQGSVIERFQNEFDNHETSDVAFIVEGKKIHAHKNLLTIGSGVFKNLFLGDWKDSCQKEHIIENHSYNAFFAFLKYFYTDEADFTPELAFEVYSLAHFYLVTDLMEECEKILKSGLTMQNVAAVYEKAILLGAKGLCEFCFEFCREHLVYAMNDIESDDRKREFFLEVFRSVADEKKERKTDSLVFH